MTRSSLFTPRLALALAGALMLGVAATANPHAPRQYYGGWQKHSKASYHYRPLYYKPAPTYAGYKHHYAVFHQSRPKHVYFYNPYQKKYWGRCDAVNGGKPQYSLLAETDRKGSLEEIPETAFPPMGTLPPVPESTDGAQLELPPDDLPAPEQGLPIK